MDFKKGILSLFAIIGLTLMVNAQTKKPTLMILPSDNWCIQRYFYNEIKNQGNTLKVPDYKKAFQEDQEIGQVISKIGSLMVQNGFPLKDAETEIKNFEKQNAIDDATASSSGSNELNKSILDRILGVSKSDILVQIWWQVTKKPTGTKEIKFTLEAIDTYTSKRVAASTGLNEYPASQSTPEMLLASVQNNISLFNNQMQGHFDNLFQNGREVKLQVKIFKDWGKNLETEFEKVPLNQKIEDWLAANTVKSKYNVATYTENQMYIEEVRIPLLDSNNRGVDARSFFRKLQESLKAAPYNIPSKLISTGLGEATLIIGDK
jgi:hypothetical protein